MSLRRGQYFSVEPSHRDPLYKTLTKNRRSNPCPAPSPPPRLPNAAPSAAAPSSIRWETGVPNRPDRAARGGRELLSSRGVLMQNKRRQLAAFRADRAIKAKLQDRGRTGRRRKTERGGRERGERFPMYFWWQLHF